MTNKPLLTERDDWRSRWLVDPDVWDELHRISSIMWEDGEMISGDGIAVCGLARRFHMPGFLSRLGLKRCDACCASLGIPPGEGAPFNALTGDDADA